MTQTFVQVPLSLLDAQGICQTAKIVYQRLMSHLNRKTGQCNPKFRTLAKELGLSYSTIQRAIKALRNNGLIRTIRTRASSAFELVGLGPRPVKNDHSRSVTDDHSRSVKNERSDDSASLLTEPDEFELEEENTAAGVNASKKAEPPKEEKLAAATAAPSVINIPKPNTSVPAADRPVSNAESMNTPKSEAQVLGEQLLRTHPSPGLPKRAFQIIEAILRKAEDPQAEAERIKSSHASWRAYWDSVPANRMIPQLWRWLESDEWQYPPVLRKGPQSVNEESRIAIEQARAKVASMRRFR